MKLNTLIGQLRILAILEGISYLSFGLTMPLKYYYLMPLPNMIVGSIHGLLFVLFCVWVIRAAIKYRWKSGKTFICLISSIVPIATFVVDNLILSHVESEK